ncbi:hypothetical protein F441_16195 [Phytophthora nicotianae CJ01A1]|uniref:Uncharacterized protein n=4 Tax=Phytophthora nicotianae TaxID=4792 RepID=W2PX27_PHYN3|nr:hypothetical protein PPTG_23547 [Phytophthora nicotianae INRA-310]ETK80551.1 hypothetical protein L915_13793 [Phytophthora nicotianae]ETP07482.1 hypothetical protein F441_16195 [Phytophthora nicotianae CJ01A1]ETP38363.1 hypothetical protein F442_13995 [Phytophthora nicotianae P10297]ETL33975.1 hypothetical protein L916_13688 [Phytophthora nicotianae]ETN05201.1 hypothetical protein PPTG_23547 [Phytophthora nicotianae INRA-310]
MVGNGIATRLLQACFRYEFVVPLVQTPEDPDSWFNAG